MLRKSTLLAIALSVAAIASPPVPAAAYHEGPYPQPVRGPVKFERPAPGKSTMRPAEMPMHFPTK